MKRYYQPEIETAPREKILEIQNEKLVKSWKSRMKSSSNKSTMSGTTSPITVI